MKAPFPARLVVETLKAALQKLESRVAVLEKAPTPAAAPCTKVGRLMLPAQGCHSSGIKDKKKSHGFHQAAPVQAKQEENGDDDDFDLFDSDEDDEEAIRIKQERLDAYAAKKSNKPALIAKSSILLDVKPVRHSGHIFASTEWRILFFFSSLVGR